MLYFSCTVLLKSVLGIFLYTFNLQVFVLELVVSDLTFITKIVVVPCLVIENSLNKKWVRRGNKNI